MKTIGIGLIGCGMIAETYHLPALKECEGIRLVMTCDSNAERSRLLAEQYGFEKWCEDYHDVLQNPEIDAVFILTKVNTHKIIAEEAARAKKHIFIQKPITDNLEDARELLEIIRENGVHFTVSFMHQYFDECVKAADILKQDIIGEVQQAHVWNCTKNPYDTAPYYGGAMLDIGSHGIELTSALFNSPIKKVLALTFDEKLAKKNFSEKNESITGEERYATLLYQLQSGIKVIHEINWSSPSNISRFQVEVVGKDASIYIRNPMSENGLAIAEKPEKQDEQSQWKYPEFEKTPFGKRQHQIFIDDIRYQRTESVSGEEAYHVLKVLSAAKKSMQSGYWENVE